MAPPVLGFLSLICCNKTQSGDVVLVLGSHEETPVVAESRRSHARDSRKIVGVTSPCPGKRNPLTELVFMGRGHALRSPSAIRIREHYEVDPRKVARSGIIEINNCIHPVNGLGRNLQNPIMEKVVVHPVIPQNLVGQNFGHAGNQLFFKNRKGYDQSFPELFVEFVRRSLEPQRPIGRNEREQIDSIVRNSVVYTVDNRNYLTVKCLKDGTQVNLITREILALEGFNEFLSEYVPDQTSRSILDAIAPLEIETGHMMVESTTTNIYADVTLVEDFFIPGPYNPDFVRAFQQKKNCDSHQLVFMKRPVVCTNCEDVARAIKLAQCTEDFDFHEHLSF